MLKKLFALIIIAFLGVQIQAVAGLYTYAENSLLAQGNWVKIRVSASGVYKLKGAPYSSRPQRQTDVVTRKR